LPCQEEEIRSDEPTQRSKKRQARHVERANYHDERSNEKYNTKRANKIICLLLYYQGTKQ
jgi:hypothetical protein